MKREIKFRFWNKKFKQWIDGEFPLIDGVFDFSTDIYEVTQFPGLKDKNGKEIYEGDILTHKYYKTPVIVTFKNGGFIAEDVYIGDSSIEVIGNIYENPELLSHA